MEISEICWRLLWNLRLTKSVSKPLDQGEKQTCLVCFGLRCCDLLLRSSIVIIDNIPILLCQYAFAEHLHEGGLDTLHLYVLLGVNILLVFKHCCKFAHLYEMILYFDINLPWLSKLYFHSQSQSCCLSVSRIRIFVSF